MSRGQWVKPTLLTRQDARPDPVALIVEAQTALVAIRAEVETAEISLPSSETRRPAFYDQTDDYLAGLGLPEA